MAATYLYYADDSVIIYCGDMREVVPGLGVEGLVDCIVADPPYMQTSLAWDRWPDGWTDVALAALRPSGSMWCFGSLRMFMRRADQFEKWSFAEDIVGADFDLIWEKHNGSGFHADRFKRVHEQAARFYRGNAPWSGVFKAPVTTPDATAKSVRTKRCPTHMGKIDKAPYVSHDGGPRLMRSVLQVRSCHGYAVNETQKPEELISPMIESSCPKGGLVLSPFAGSGTDGVVAKRLGMSAILIEMREDQCEKAARRIAAVVAGT